MSSAIFLGVFSIILVLVLYFVGRNVSPEAERGIFNNFVTGIETFIGGFTK